MHNGAETLKRSLDTEALDQCFDDSRGRHEVTVTFFGGEPLLNFALIKDLVAYADRRAKADGKQVWFSMTTNLTLMTEEIADFLVKHRFRVLVSIDGGEVRHNEHRVYRDGRGSFTEVADNLRKLTKLSLASGVRPPRVRATASPKNWDSQAIHDELVQVGAELIMVGDAFSEIASESPWTEQEQRDAAEAVSRVQGQTAEVIRKFASAGLEEGVLPDQVRERLDGIAEKLTAKKLRPVTPSYCGVCRNMKAVSANGTLYPCHRYVGMPAFELGSVQAGGADSERVAQYYAKLNGSWRAKCATCWAHDLCGGTCPWMRSASNGEVLPPSDSDCRNILHSMEQYLELYALTQRHCADAAP